MKLPKFEPWEPVMINWNDATAATEGWHKVRKHERLITGCVTVGQVEKQTKDTLTIVLSHDTRSGDVYGCITIPTAVITMFARLTRPHADG